MTFSFFKRLYLVIFALQFFALSACSDQVLRFRKDGINTDYAAADVDSRTLYAYPKQEDIQDMPLQPLEARTQASLSKDFSNNNFHLQQENTILQQPAGQEEQGAQLREYQVKTGDTLFSIANREGVKLQDIKRLNNLEGEDIEPGQSLQIPRRQQSHPPESFKAQEDLTIPQKEQSSAKKMSEEPKISKGEEPRPAERQQVMQSNIKTEVASQHSELGGFLYPVKGTVVEEFGHSYRGHKNNGLDFKVELGTPVKASASGVVLYAGGGLKEFGNTVLIKHERDLVTVYGYNSELLVKRGQQVKAGQIIAKSGQKLTTKTPCLHFEVRRGATAVDPRPFFKG